MPSTTPPADRLGSGDGIDVAQTLALGGVATVAYATYGQWQTWGHRATPPHTQMPTSKVQRQTHYRR